MAASLHALERYADLRGADRGLFWLASFSFFPVLVALSQGQTSIVLLAALIACFLALRSGHQFVAGVALSLVLIKPPYIIPLLLVLAVRRQWGALAAFLTSAAVYAFAAFMVVGSAGVGGYLSTTFQAMGWQSQIGGFAPKWNQSFEGFTQLLLSPHWARFLVSRYPSRRWQPWAGTHVGRNLSIRPSPWRWWSVCL